jgi:hypothetical protein
LPRSINKNSGAAFLIKVQARLTRTFSTWPGSQLTSMFIGAQQTSQSSMVE